MNGNRGVERIADDIVEVEAREALRLGKLRKSIMGRVRSVLREQMPDDAG